MGKVSPEKRREYYLRQQAIIKDAPKIECACGCGSLIPSVRADGKPAKYKKGHNKSGGELQPGQEPWNKGKECPYVSEIHQGKKLPQEEIAKRTASRRANPNNENDWGSVGRGYKLSDETKQKMSERSKGENNPFYGKKHTPESIAKMSESSSGERAPGWRGGVGTLPYGPEFTRKFKRTIIERDGHICQRCRRHQSMLPRTLQVHHLDHDKMNNDSANLAAACNSCNIWASYHRDEPFVIVTD